MPINYSSELGRPYHLSVGAVLINDQGQICCHYFPLQDRYERIYLLMRETMEEGESPETALHRGLKEEFAAKADAEAYLGSIVSEFLNEEVGAMAQKTTLYFLCRLKEQDVLKRDPYDEEAPSEIQWQDADFLIAKMQDQFLRYGRSDQDESSVLERLKSYLQHQQP
jgi:ADP-ribose pyrophosphatase YjhB (NUDIX family)